MSTLHTPAAAPTSSDTAGQDPTHDDAPETNRATAGVDGGIGCAVPAAAVTTPAVLGIPLRQPPRSMGPTHLYRLTYLVAVAASFGLGPLCSKLPTTLGAVCLVALGVGLALAASGALHSYAVVGGSLGALASGLGSAVAPGLAGAVLVAFCFLERTLRVQGPLARLVHVALALGGGALGGILAAHYLSAELSMRVVAIVVAAVLAALPLLVDADDPRAHALDDLARQVPPPTDELLHRGADLCRTADESILQPALLRQVRGSWRRLLELGRARARLTRSAASHLGAAPMALPAGSRHAAAVARRIDQQIADHVEVLTRAFTAAHAAQAAELSLDDRTLRSVQNTGESLEQVAEAIVEDSLP